MSRRSSSASPSPIDVIEAAYELERSDRDWLEHLAITIRPLLEDGHGVIAYEYDRATPMKSWLTNEITVGFPRTLLPHHRGFLLSRAPQSNTMHAYPKPLAALRESLRDAGFRELRENRIAMRHLEHIGACDTVAFRTIEAEGRGICIGGFQDRVRHLDRRTIALWTHVAAHVAAARRLRVALRTATSPDAGVEAVLAPSGKLEHAEGEGKQRSAREALREAVVRVETARGRMRRDDPVRATEVWHALVSGRWSLVDRYERGGKRYVVARRNEHDLRDPRALSPRERAVVHLALLGKPNKLIGYELGISASSVASHLGSAMRKLGVRSRIELIRLARQLGAPRSDAAK